jgi:hypothetical protein
MTKAWNVEKGNKAAIIAPSLPVEAKFSAEDFRQYKNSLASIGLELAMEDSLPQEEYYQWMGTPQQRAEQIIAVLNDPEIKVIFIAGGSCGGEVLEILKKEKHRLPKAPGNGVVAFCVSDGNQTAHFLGQELGIVSAVETTSPLLSDKELAGEPEYPDNEKYLADFEMRKKHIETIKDFLFEQKTQEFPLVALNEKDVEFAKNGFQGKMTTYDHNDRRSSYRAVLSDVVDGVDEYPVIALLEVGQHGGRKTEQGLRTFLTHMLESGDVPQAAFLSVSDGQCFNGKSIYEANIDSLKEVANEMREKFEEKGLKMPAMFFGAPFGHPQSRYERAAQMPLPFHTNSQIAIKNGEIILSCEAARDLENMHQVEEICERRGQYKDKFVEESQEVAPVGGALKISRIASGKWSQKFQSKKQSFGEETDLLVCAIGKQHHLYEARGLQERDLTAKNCALVLDFSYPPFEIWQSDGFQLSQRNGIKDPNLRTEERYRQEKEAMFKKAAIQSVTEALIELRKNPTFHKANSCSVLVNMDGYDENFKNILEGRIKDFSSQEEICPVYIGKAEPEICLALRPAEIQQPKGPPISLDCVLVQANVQEVGAVKNLVRDFEAMAAGSFAERFGDDAKKYAGKSH